MGWGIATIVGAGAVVCLVVTAPGMVFAQAPGQSPAGCPVRGAPHKSTKAFVEAYQAATMQIRNRDFAAAASAADTAAAAATGENEKLAVANIRFAAYVGLRDKPRATAALQVLKDIGCLPLGEAEKGQATIDRLEQPN